METVARFFEPFGCFVDNRINPLFLREVRQLVRNRFIIVLLNLFIGALVFACMMAVIFSDGSRTNATGMGLFQAQWGIMSFACFLAVVVYTAMTTSSERIGGDLMFTSAMKPSAIVFGKAYAGLVLTILLMTVTAPFVTLAYLLRGLDIEFVAVVFITMFVSIQMCNAIAICIFSNVKTKVQMSSILAVGFFVMIILFVNVVPMIARSFFVGGGGNIIDWDSLIWAFAIQLAVTALFLAGAITTISPPTSNRMLPLRLTVTAMYVGSFLLCVFFPSVVMAPIPLAPWIVGWLGGFIFLSLVVVSERDRWSYRIKQSVPRNLLLRVIAFPFYTGSPNGLVWYGLMFAGVLYAAFASGYANDVFEHPSFYYFLFAFAYCATAMLIRCLLLPRLVTSDKTWAIVVFLLLVCLLGSMLVFALTEMNVTVYNNFFDEYGDSWLSLLNPAYLDYSITPGTDRHAMAAFFWATGLLPILGIWFLLRIIHFSPHDRSETMTLEQAVAAVRDADANPLVQGERERQRKMEKAREFKTEEE